MTEYILSINGTSRKVEVAPDTPLLWVLRAQCGACTIHLDGQASRSCSVPISSIKDKKITTIEGLSVGK